MSERVIARSGRQTAETTAREGDDYLYITNGKTEVSFSKSNGMLSGVVYDGRQVSLSEGTQLEEANPVFSEIKHYADGNRYIVEVIHSGGAVFNPRWIMQPDGWLELDVGFRMNGIFDNLGINFS